MPSAASDRVTGPLRSEYVVIPQELVLLQPITSQNYPFLMHLPQVLMDTCIFSSNLHEDEVATSWRVGVSGEEKGELLDEV